MRCHYDTEKKNNLVRHLTSKEACPSTFTDTPREQLLSDLQRKASKNFLCECGAKYSHKSCLSRHKRTCTTVDLQSAELVKLQKENAKLKKTLNKQQVVINNNTTINNTNNITVNITRLNFGNEKIDYITNAHDFLQDCISNRDIIPIIESIWCDKEHPENHNVRIKNVNQKIMEKYDDNEWQPVEQDEMLEQLLNRGYYVLRVYIRNNEYDVLEQCCDDDEDDFDKVKRWLLTECDDPKAMKKVKKNVVVLFIKNKMLLLGKK